ncbi:MAG: hypothetical protein WBP55_10450 [Solirubrobacterales bacterium]
MNLDEAGAPADITAGWKEDPLAESEWRYWDGDAWSNRVGTSQTMAASTPTGSAGSFAAPNKVCPHCGAGSQTVAKKCPNCGKGYKKRTGLKIFAAICVVGLVSVVGCSALLIGGVNEAVNELNEEQEQHAISKSMFNRIEIGMTEKQVRELTGKVPEDRQSFESEGFLSEEPSTSKCIYYNKSGGEFLDSFQLCFDEGKLRSKNDF